MLTATVNFDWPPEMLQAACLANGYTGDTLRTTIKEDGLPVTEEVTQTIEEFFGDLLKKMSISDIIRTTTYFLERKKWTDNYNANEMFDTVMQSINVSVAITQ